MGISMAAGVVGGLLWFLLWRRFNLTGGALVLMGLVMGFLLAAFIFATPFGASRGLKPIFFLKPYLRRKLGLKNFYVNLPRLPLFLSGDLNAFTNGFNYSMAFACLAIVWPVVLLLKGRLVRERCGFLPGHGTMIFTLNF